MSQTSEEPVTVLEKKEPGPKWSKYFKIGAILILIAILVFVVVDSTVGDSRVKSVLTDFLDAVEDLGFWGAVLFALVYVVATVLLIPGTILTLGAGFVFTRTNGGDNVAGTLIATAVVFVGATAGATLAFIFARFLLRDAATKLTEKYKVFRAIDKAIETNGLKIVFLLRLSPAIPFNVLNYILGTTNVTLREYVLACFGLLPGTIAFCFVGSTLGSLSDVEEGGENSDGSGDTAKLIILIVGGVASIIAVVLITIYARRELKKYLDEAQENDVETGEAVETQPNTPSTSEAPYVKT